MHSCSESSLTHTHTHTYTYAHTHIQKGSLVLDDDGVNPLDKHMTMMAKYAGKFSDAPPAPWMFAIAGQEHSKRSGDCHVTWKVMSCDLIKEHLFT